ncbi:MAG TPA: RNA methyltransferase [Bacteroidales bacterium]|nr:RNA methyltransferase [Bacteroidales bacterium]
MPTATDIKIFRSLKDKSSREEHGFFVAETPKVVSDLIAGGLSVKVIYSLHDVLSDWQKQFPHLKIEGVSNKELERLSFLKQPHEVCAAFNIPEKKKFVQQAVTLILDNISDPGNMGTIMRTAHWFGIKNIICTKNSVDIYNPKVVQSTMGSLARVHVHYCSKEEIASMLEKNTTICGAFMDGENIFTTQINAPVAIIIGNEAHGVQSLGSLVQRRISIPAHNADDHAESLNASVAAAIIMSMVSKFSE